MNVAMEIILPGMATLATGIILWAARNISQHGQDLAAVREQLTPANGRRLSDLVIEHSVAIAQIQAEVRDIRREQKR